MRRVCRSSFPFALGLAVALAAGAARGGDPARNIGDIDPAESRDVGGANTASSRDLEEALGDEPQDAHVVDASEPDAAASNRPDGHETTPLEQADRDPEWVPPPCEEVALELGATPPAEDANGWANLLRNAEASVERSRAKLAAADSEYTYARNRRRPRGAALQEIIASRDQARVDTAKARCMLPALVEAARRAGVSAAVWRAFPASQP